MRILIRFTDRISGERAVRHLLDSKPPVPFEVELLAIAEPLTCGKVRIFLAPQRAESMIRDAGKQSIAALSQLLSAEGISFQALMSVGRGSVILGRALRRTDVDSILLAAPISGWLGTIWAKWRVACLPHSASRSIIVVP